MKQQLTTQKADALLSSVIKLADNVAFDVRLTLHFMQNQIGAMPLAGSGEILAGADLPGVAAVLMLDVVVAKVQVALDDWFSKNLVRPESGTIPRKLVPVRSTFCSRSEGQ